MGSVDIGLLDDLDARGLVSQMTSEKELRDHLSEPRTLYCGFDPTADSLHIGSLVPLLTLKRFQMAGHKPLALVGGATGLIGDPSGKTKERSLNGPETVEGWVDRLKSQISQFVDFECGANSAAIVNNLDWTANLDVLSFLRNVGKHFSVNNMVQKESVKQRIDREGEGISFTEFTYMILQSYDFAELYSQHACTLQIGGSDQWGNITGGVDLSRRMYSGKVFGLTLPLVTKADGTKFGKTAGGTIWLDDKKTSPYVFYQFWLNTADDDVYKFLRYFTFLTIEEIGEIEAADAETAGRPMAQRVLADQVTKLVHGSSGLAAAQRITGGLFSGELSDLSEADFDQLALDGLPFKTLSSEDLDQPLTTLITEAGLAKSGREVKDALSRQAVYVNGDAKGVEDNMNAQACFARSLSYHNRFFLVKLGKKKHQLFELR